MWLFERADVPVLVQVLTVSSLMVHEKTVTIASRRGAYLVKEKELGGETLFPSLSYDAL